MPRVLIKYLFRWKTITKWEITLVKIECCIDVCLYIKPFMQQYSSHKPWQQIHLLLSFDENKVEHCRCRLHYPYAIWLHLEVNKGKEREKNDMNKLKPIASMGTYIYILSLTRCLWRCPLYAHINNDVWHSFFIISLGHICLLASCIQFRNLCVRWDRILFAHHKWHRIAASIFNKRSRKWNKIKTKIFSTK